MIKRINLTALLVLVICGTENFAQSVYMPRNPSPSATIKQRVGASVISINYSRPSVVAVNGTDRTGHIWGEMVPYDFELRSSYGNQKPIPWRAGANENTVIRISHDATVEGKKLPAGTYGLMVAIHRDGGATVIFSKDTASWGSFFYEEDHDALRVRVKTEEIPLTKRLVYNFYDVTKNHCLVTLDWEKKRIPFSIIFDTDGTVVKALKEKIENLKEPGWRDYYNAARYCYQNDVNLEVALAWAEQSTMYKTTFANQVLWAGLLSKTGKQKEADKLMKAVLGKEDVTDENYYFYGQDLIGQRKYKEAIKLFGQLGDKWPESWLQYHGAARVYSAMHEFEKALVNEKKALIGAPEANKYYVNRAIKMLEAGIDFNTL